MADEKPDTTEPETTVPAAEGGEKAEPKPKRARAKRAPAKAKAKADPEAEGAQAAAETKPKRRPKAKPEAKAEAKPEAKAKAKAEAKPESEAKPEPEAGAPEAGAPEGEEGAGEPQAAAAPRGRRRGGEPSGEPPIVRAQARYVRSSARKARLVCDHLRGRSVEEARAILSHTGRAVARDWSKLLESAVANAEHNHDLDGDDLRVLAVHADEGPTLKRFRPRAMGRATRIRKRTSHLTIALTPKE